MINLVAVGLVFRLSESWLTLGTLSSASFSLAIVLLALHLANWIGARATSLLQLIPDGTSLTNWVVLNIVLVFVECAMSYTLSNTNSNSVI